MRPANSSAQNLLVLPIATAIGVLIVFVLRDGFQIGDLIGAFATGLVAYLVVFLIRRSRNS